MKLILCDVENNPLKRWAQMYGCEPGWSLTKDSVYEILSTPDTHPALDTAWPEFLAEVEYWEGDRTYKLCVHQGDLYLGE